MTQFVDRLDSDGNKIGYSYTISDGTDTSTTLYDLNFEETGVQFTDSATSVTTSYEKVVASDGSYTETETFSKPGEESRSFTENFNSSGVFTGATETQGLTTYTYDANFNITNQTTNTSSLPTITSSTGIPTALLDSSDASTTKILVKNFDGGGSQTTYFASNGTLLGYSDTWTDSGYSNTNYNDADWNYLGGSFNDTANGFSGSYFSTTQKDGSGNVTGYVDTGTDKQVDSDGNTVFERSYTFNFDTSYNLTSGTETENEIGRAHV